MVRRFTIFGILLLVLLYHASMADVYMTETESVRVGSRLVDVDTAGVHRTHDFGPTGGFYDIANRHSRLATLISAVQGANNIVLSGNHIMNEGVPGRTFWTPQSVVMANRAGEGKPGEPCRAQASSYPVRPDIPLTWLLRLSLGDSSTGNPWTLLPTGQDPVLLWQLKASGLRPSLAMVVDTDDTNSSKLMIYFSQLSGTASKVQRVGTIRGISTDIPVDIRISAFLDERDLVAGGVGHWHAWVNDQLVVDRVGPTLSSFATEPHQWFFGMYRYLTNCPSTIPRFTRWESIKLEHGINLPGKVK